MAKKTQKTHKGLRKVVSKSGKTGHPGSRHNTGKKSSKFNRTKRSKGSVSKADMKRLKDLI